MPSAFELLTEHSTAPSGSTAWEHINAQEGGGGTAGDVYISEMVTIVDEDDLNFFSDEEIDLLFSDDVDAQSLDFNDDDIDDIDDDLQMVEL